MIIQGFFAYGALILFVIGAFAGGGNPFLLLAGGIVALAAVLVGYHVIFEVYVGGQTPGKRMVGVRVVRMDGGPLRLSHSLIRTFLRIVDYMPGFYGIGLIAVFASSRNQRLGDMAAGTVVVLDRSRHPRRTESRLQPSDAYEDFDAFLTRNDPVPVHAAGWDVSRVTDEEVGLTRRFLERRATLDEGARRALAADLAGRLRQKVVAPTASLTNEQLLAEIVRIKTGENV